MSNSYLYISIFFCALATFLTRILAFILFSKTGETPTLNYLKKHLPVMIMTILIFYGLSGSNLETTYAVPEIAAIMLSVLLHLKTKNALASIFISTIFYMIMLQSLFV